MIGIARNCFSGQTVLFLTHDDEWSFLWDSCRSVPRPNDHAWIQIVEIATSSRIWALGSRRLPCGETHLVTGSIVSHQSSCHLRVAMLPEYPFPSIFFSAILRIQSHTPRLVVLVQCVDNVLLADVAPGELHVNREEEDLALLGLLWKS